MPHVTEYCAVIGMHSTAQGTWPQSSLSPTLWSTYQSKAVNIKNAMQQGRKLYFRKCCHHCPTGLHN